MDHSMNWIFAVLSVTVFIATADADVAKVGNRVVAGRPTDQNNTAYLLDRAFGVDGILFAISAYFIDIHPIAVGIWRPMDPNDRAAGYTLVQQWTYTAIKANRREDIYLQTFTSNKTCFRVTANDRLGLYIADKNGSVAYDFVGGSTVANTLQLRMEKTPQVGQLFEFDVLSWPYQFSLAAYLDTDVGRYASGETNPLCFSDVQIPEDDTDGYEAVDSTGPMGATGSTGQAGPAGATGLPGARGDRGPTGENGVKGETGETGPVGATGEQGKQGATGPIGPAGPAGQIGTTGAKGEKGDAGIPGSDGNITMIQVESMSSGLFSEDCSWCPKFMSPYLVLALVIWLIIVTICLFITILTICCKKDPKPQHYQRNIHTNNDHLWRKYENGGFDEKQVPKEDNTYSAIEEGRTEF